MKRFALILIAAVATVSAGYWANGIAADKPADAKVPDGKPIFVENKCGSCHSIEAQGLKKVVAEGTDAAAAEAAGGIASKAPDLSGVGHVRSAEWMSGFMQKKEKLAGKLHIKKFKGTDEELAQLTGWLASLKDEEAGKKLKAADEAKEAAAKAAEKAAESTEPK